MIVYFPDVMDITQSDRASSIMELHRWTRHISCVVFGMFRWDSQVTVYSCLHSLAVFTHVLSTSVKLFVTVPPPPLSSNNVQIQFQLLSDVEQVEQQCG